MGRNKKKRNRSKSDPNDFSQIVTQKRLKSVTQQEANPPPNDEPAYFKVDNAFLTEKDGKAFKDLVRDHYKGFVHLSAEELKPQNFHARARQALEHLRDANYYQYDIVMAGGKHTSRTFVKRTLVGDPGITYKYLGLRLFAHAWSGPNAQPMMKAIGDLNADMIRMTKTLEGHGKCDYNLTLINFMEPLSHSNIGFKDEALYGMGKVSVSWHADSSLQDNSSIGVYHCLPTQKASKWDWRIALRKNPDGKSNEDKVLPISVGTKDGDAYFLLGTFNETHQHCVLSGSESNRISSTHRVAVTGEDTYEYIKKRAKSAIKRMTLAMKSNITKVDPKVIVFCQRVLTEVEMDWIAQYWLQGEQHDKMHLWWQKPMRILESLWENLEELTYEFYTTCIQRPREVPRLAVKGFLLELESRQTSRKQWDDRRADKIYEKRIKPGFRPVARPKFNDKVKSRLPKDLESAIVEIRTVRKKQIEASKDK